MRLHSVGRLRLLDHATQSRHGAIDPVLDLDQDASPSRVAATLVPDVDLHLFAQAQRFDGRVEHGSVSPGVDQRPERHVARDAGEAVEVGDRHSRVLLMRTAAASMGCMLAGLLAPRTETDSTRGRASTFWAIAAARDSSSLRDSPSIPSRAAARTAV